MMKLSSFDAEGYNKRINLGKASIPTIPDEYKVFLAETCATAVDIANKLIQRDSGHTPIDFIELPDLTEQETKDAILEAKKKKYFHEKHKAYWEEQEKIKP